MRGWLGGDDRALHVLCKEIDHDRGAAIAIVVVALAAVVGRRLERRWLHQWNQGHAKASAVVTGHVQPVIH
eukprot:3319875-Prymnesium_polylepis.1